MQYSYINLYMIENFIFKLFIKLNLDLFSLRNGFFNKVKDYFKFFFNIYCL